MVENRYGRIALYHAPNAPFVVRDYPLRPVAPGEALVRVSMCTICGSDVHSYQGRRPNPLPGLLGHEIIGVIEELGGDGLRDLRGDPLAAGDRVTWTEYFAVGPSWERDILDMPQNATPLNCGAATMVAVTEAAGIGVGDTVAVQGLGLLGLYGVALARARGARLIIGIDAVPARRALAARFGADLALAPDDAVSDRVRDAVGHRDGVDVAMEVCGVAAALRDGLSLLRVGGRYVVAGLVTPGSAVTLEADVIVRRWITIRGVHNYHPRHLVQALDFVVAERWRFPFRDLV